MPLKRNIIANYVGQGWSALMGLAFIPLYIKYLGIEAYGLIGLYAVMQACLTLLDIGMTPTLGREMARFTAGAHTPKSIRDLLRSLEIVCLGLALLIGFAIWAASDWLASDWLRSERLPVHVVAQAISIMALVAALRFCEGIYRSALIGLQKQVWYNSAQAIISTIRYGGAVSILAFYSPTIEAFFYWQALVSFLALTVFSGKLKSTLPRSEIPSAFSLKAITAIWRFASGMMAITFLKLMLTQVDKILLSRLLSLEHFGYYTLAATVSVVLFSLIGPIMQAIYPRMVQFIVEDDQPRLIDIYHEGSQLVTVITSSVLLLLVFFAENVIYTWSGDINLSRNVGPILSILALGSFLNGLMWMPYQCQLAHGWVKLGVGINAIAVCLLMPAILWLVPMFGAVGAAWIWVALNSAYVLVGIHFMHLRVLPGEKWRWYGSDVMLPSMGPIMVLVVASFIKPVNSTGRIEWLMFLMVSTIFGFVASALLSNRIRRRIRQLVNRALNFK